MMWEAREAVRCSATLNQGDGIVAAMLPASASLQCSLAYDHPHGHVYVTGSWVPDRHSATEAHNGV